MFLPDQQNAHFIFTSDVGYFITKFTVEGTPSSAGDSEAGPSSSQRVLSFLGSRPPSAPVIGNKKSTGSTNVKIVKADMERVGKTTQFKSKRVDFIKVTEETANVRYLSHAVKEKWGEQFILVTADGMELEDSSGTQGWSAL